MSGFSFSPVKKEQIVSVPGWFVWCGSMVRTPDGRCHMFVSMWEEKWGFEYGWATHSKVGYAVADEPDGKYEFRGIIFEGSGKENGWDRDSVHNPYVFYDDGRFWLYYSGNCGDGNYSVHTSNQRVGLASAVDPMGEWTRSGEPLFGSRPGMFDESGTTNPSVCRRPDGRLIMIYKCWSDLPPHDGKVRIAAAFADHPAGPWERMDVPIFDVPGEMFAAEDPYVYSQGGKIYCLLKDMGNFYIHDVFRSMIRFVSDDGIDWKPAEPMFFRSRVMDFEGEGKKLLYRMERPFLYIEDDKPQVFFTAILPERTAPFSCNVHMNIEWKE